MVNNDQPDPIPIGKEGISLLTDPRLNKGTAFPDAERDLFSLHGLLPPHHGDLDDQVQRRLDALNELDDELQKYLQLRSLQDSNETLFHALIERNLDVMLPLVYTPTVGRGCEEFSHHWHHPRGLFISYPQRERMEDMLAHPRFDGVRVIVVSDGERILGLGDQGAGGMGIPIGKLSLYSACAGINPASTLPVLLDTGTDNAERLNDPVYIGWRHERIRGDEYDDFVDRFVAAVQKRWPHVLLQFEDFAQSNALRLLKRYRDCLCTFNDDIQGTAAVAAGTLLAAARATHTRLGDQTIVIFGGGSAGCGIGRKLMSLMVGEGLSEDEASQRFYMLDKQGLLVQGDAELKDFQQPFARRRANLNDWVGIEDKKIELIDVVRNVHPTVLLGVSGQGDAFDEEVIRLMAQHADRPIILPLSNPEGHCEAKPQDVMDWTESRALIGTGSPFGKVKSGGKAFSVAQVNNAYIFPGVGLGVIAVNAHHVSEAMFTAAARALGDSFDVSAQGPGRLLPPIDRLRDVARHVARAVALQAQNDGLCEPFDESGLRALIEKHIWTPTYCPYTRKD